MSYDNFCRTARRSTRDVARSNMAPVHAIRASPCSLYGYCSDTMFLLDLRCIRSAISILSVSCFPFTGVLVETRVYIYIYITYIFATATFDTR